jgi:16S rRNA (cytosine967-C5)-methyltransferase
LQKHFGVIMREENRLRFVLKILSQYKRNETLSVFLKSFFRQNPQMGSQDRRITSELIYNFFRTGNSLDGFSDEERIAFSSFLCSSSPNAMTSYLVKKYLSFTDIDIELPLQKKIILLQAAVPSFNFNSVFPFADLLSKKINGEKFSKSFLHQPKVFIRLRRKFMNEVLAELNEKNILFETVEGNPNALAFTNSTPLTKLKSFEKGLFEIQDLSSQQTLSLIYPNPNEFWWDCFSGSGGKSLIMIDEQPSLKIFASDVRASILENLKSRFQKTDFKNYECAVVDLINGSEISFATKIKKNISGIVADVPCTGSGTWARTPEWLSMFQPAQLEKYQTMQRKAVQNLVPFLQTGMSLVYITCSVFKKENEDNIEYFSNQLNLGVEEECYFEGSAYGADTLFAARLIRK